MARNPFKDMDPDLNALPGAPRPASDRMRWGRVLTGVLVVACVTFAFAYYLPLLRAQEALTRNFSEAESQLGALTHAAEDARSQLKAADASKQALQSKIDEAKRTEGRSEDATHSVTSSLESKLHKQIEKSQVAVAALDGQAVAMLELGFVLSPGKLDVSAAGKVALCSVASAADKRTFRVLAIAEKKNIPLPLAGKLKTPLQFTGAVATLVAETLISKCRIEPARVSATGFAAEPAAHAKLVGKSLSGARVELWLDNNE